MIKASVIVITYNGRHHLDACFRSLEKQSVEAHETILIDNGSQDGSADFVRRNFPRVRVIESKTNLGFAGGNNLAAKEASGEVLVFLNDDTEVSPNWLERVLSPFDSDPRIAIVGCKMIDFFHRDVEVRVLCDLFGSAINDGIPRTPASQGYQVRDAVLAKEPVVSVGYVVWRFLQLEKLAEICPPERRSARKSSC